MFAFSAIVVAISEVLLSVRVGLCKFLSCYNLPKLFTVSEIQMQVDFPYLVHQTDSGRTVLCNYCGIFLLNEVFCRGDLVFSLTE